MRTDELIAALATEPAGRPVTLPSERATVALGMGVALTLALFALVYGPRPDLVGQLGEPLTAAKTLLALAVGLLALPACLRLGRPGQGMGRGAPALWLVPLAGLILAGAAFAAATPAERLVQFIGHSIPVCLPSIVLLATPVGVGLFVRLRRDAPVRPVLCGAMAGLAAAGLATTLYSLFCTEDSPLFYVPWYGVGMLITTALGALAGHRWLRW